MDRMTERGGRQTKSGWRPREWGDATGICRSKIYDLLDAGAIQSVKVGRARVITTDPADYLASLAEAAA